MTARPYCQHPDACVVTKRATVHCRPCDVARRKSREYIQETSERAKAAFRRLDAQQTPFRPKDEVEVPAWVPLTLHARYLAVADYQGEEKAASVCRQLKRRALEALR